MDMKHWATHNLIHHIISGSHLYGTNRPDSDFDYRGVCLMPLNVLLGLDSFEQYQASKDEGDIEIFALNKFVRLALDCNPNILDILFAPPDRWLTKTWQWERIYNKRHIFLSEKVRHTFSGYAYAQLKRLQGHRKWLTGEVPLEPQLKWYNCWITKDKNGGERIVGDTESDKKAYDAAKLYWDNYQRWLRERNPKRLEIEKRVGYDTKNAAHLVRLLVKAEQILRDGDYDPVLEGISLGYVKEVLGGYESYEALIDFAQRQEEVVKTMQTSLPYSSDYVAANGLVIDINYNSVTSKE